MAAKVYLAGPEVFFPNARELIARKHAMLAEFGLLPSARQGEFLTWTESSPGEIGLEISRHNEQLIEEADLLIANITPFRSISADPGTVYELGYMCALGGAVYAYSNDARDYAERAALHPALAPTGYAADGRLRAQDETAIEAHGFAENLMIDGGILRRAGAVIRHPARPESLWTDLAGFRACLEHIVR
jgi:nucleoside 2-deoxyribosyltransferase